MACQLYTENDLSALYSVVRGEIMDKINDPSTGKFNQTAFNKLIRDIYKELSDDPVNAELYAQAIPDILMIVANDVDIKRYLRSPEVNLDFNYVQDLSLEFEDLENVMKFVLPKAVKKTKGQVDSEIKKKNKQSKDVVQKNDNDKSTPWSAVQEKALVDFPDKTSGNIAIAKNPETMTEEERNNVDKQKELFYEIIKTVVWASRRRGDTDQVMLGDIPVMLKAQPIRSLDAADLTSDDTNYLSRNKSYSLNVAVISDTEGNPIRFDEQGNVVETGGRIVYQYIRPVVNSNGKLYLGNRSGFLYSLIPATKLAEREIRQRTIEGELLGQAERDEVLSRIKREQTQKMNDLARLNEKLATDTQPVLLPITGGSYGIVEGKSALLSQTPFADDLDMIYTHDSGALEGLSYFIVNKVKAGVAIDNRIYLQRMDMTDAIAKNIAKVLTTQALLNGEPLNPQIRIAYYENFLSNRTTGNNFTVEIDTVLGQNVLKVTITDPITKESNTIDLNAPGAEKIISDHLMATKKLEDKNNPGSYITYPASMSYMKSFAIDGAIQKGQRFTDYDFATSKSGAEVIREVKKDYFDFIKPLAKVDYTKDPIGYFVGINAYMNFAIPMDLETPADSLIEIGMPVIEDIEKDEEPKPKAKQKAEIEEDIDEETGEKVKFKMEVWPSTLADAATISANVNEADGTFGIGVDFSTKDEKHAETKAGQKNKWYGLKLGSKTSSPKNFTPSADSINQIVKNLIETGGPVMHIIGNDIAILEKQGYNQQDIDKYVYNILKEVVKQFPIQKIISNGQTGIAEASIKAAKRLGIPVKIRAFTGYRLRTSAPYLSIGYKSEKNTKAEFVKRFYSKSSTTYKKAAAKVSTEKIDKTTTAPKTVKVQGRVVEVAGKTVEEQKVIDSKINKLAIDDLLGGSDIIPDIPFEADRSKRASALMNQLYGDKRSWEEVQKWWSNSPLKNIVDLERLALVFNSDAYGKFMSAGSLLADASVKLRKKGFAARIELYGDALPVTLYHEAWHAFSQLVLTKEEKTKLYDEIRSNKKWATMEYIEIEEELAENFIDYAANGKKQEGFIQKIFNKIKSIIDFFFGNTTKRDVTRLEDIPNVKKYYEQLYTGKFIVSTENAENNLMPGFQRLNSSKKTIQPLTNVAKDFLEITDVQSNKIVNIMDTLMARSFYQYNSKFNTTSGAVRLLGNINNRQQLYSTIEKQLKLLLDRQIETTRTVMLGNADPANENPDYDLEQKEVAKLELLMKAVENYGAVDEALSKKTDKGVVAFHMQRSRFSVLKDSYIDDTEDATTALFKSTEGNSIAAKQLATDDTMMMISGIYKLKTDENGDYVKEINEEGVEGYVNMLDEFGLPVLEDVSVMWNRLARTLQGSLDYLEMHDRMSEAIDNYPEFIQVLEMLPNPYMTAPGAYNNKTEFQSETNFWQDLKKPVIPFVQLNINKTVVEKAKVVDGKKIPEKATYESRLAAANLDIYKIINDWTTNFNIADNAVNKYIIKDLNDGTNYLDTKKIMQDFGRKGQLIPEKAMEFLKALGINLDMTSAEIKKIVRNTEKPFSSRYNIDYIFNNIRLVHLAGKADDLSLNAAADLVKAQPLYYLMNDLPEAIVTAAGGKSRDVKTKVRTLAELQNRFSDGYSNYSVLSPEKNKVWEQFVDNTITRVVTSINLAKNWQELTTAAADPNGRFQHMRWLSEANNTGTQFSVMLNSVFDMNPMSDTYGEKLPGAKILLENIGGTQIINKATNESTGTSTASTDVTSKFLQEFHTMLQSGVQEFMRHASKQTAMNMRAGKIDTYSGKDSDNLYVDIMAFSPANTVANNNFGESQGFNIMLGYLAAEAGRIFRYKSDKKKFQEFAGYNRKVIRVDDDSIVDAGEAFTAFDDILTPEVQADLYAIIDRAVEEKIDFEDFNFKDIINEDQSLRQLVKNDVVDYFNKISVQNYNRLEDARYVDQSLYDMVSSDELSKNQVDKMLVKAYTYNSWIHNYETVILAYGDLVQYNHDKEEFHKRNAGLGSGGRGFRADMRARAFINSPLYQRLYAEKEGYELNAYDGTLTSAIIKEVTIAKSVYKDEYYKKHVAQYTERYIKAGRSKAEAKRLAEDLANTVLGEYEGMKIADGQGYVNFEAYRMLKHLEGSWSTKQEDLYKKIVNKELITASDIKEFFPPYKLQYYGNMKTTGLSLVSFHKFSLAPIIPSVHTANTELGQIHDMMLKQNVDYILMETGSKVGHVGTGDNIFDEDGNIDTSAEFTKNVIFTEYLKNQTEVNNTYKGKSIFSTQLRKLILEGLYEQGQIETTDESGITNQLVINYIDRVSEYTELLKNELIDEIGFEQTPTGEYVPADKNSIAKLTEMIRANLTRDDVLSDNLIDIIDVTAEGELRFDLSLHPEANKIEKLLLSLINKRIIKQKVKGEALVQKSSAFYKGLFDLNTEDGLKLLRTEKGSAKRDAVIKKYMGSNFLPTYHEGADGKTTAMKVAISLQGDYENLLNLEYRGEPIDTIERLNQAIKDDEWLDSDNGSNRKAITMVGVRIPVQGLNSMEFMEIYHFLDPSAGNIIIPPAEIVAKSGADFDIDKLSIFMNGIDGDGNVKTTMFEDSADFYDAIKDPSKYNMTKAQMYAAQKSGLENQLINDIRSILELPQNYVSLTTPNGTYLVKPIADRLSEFVTDYSSFNNMMTKDKLSAPDKNGKQKKVISPTRILEAGYNLYKHESNVVGKRTLGLGAIENTFNVVFNSLGATMPAVYKHSKEEEERVSFLGLRHNRMTKNGEDVISLSNQYDVDGINKVADIINQLMNGWVDVEKDAWVFFVQGNYEVAPILLYLLKTGVPIEEAVYFVSQPLVRDYVKEKRLAESTFAEPLRKDPGFQGVNFKASSNVIAKNFKKFLADNRTRYETGRNMMENYFDTNKRTSEEDKHFTSEEMLKLIKDSKVNPEVAKSDLSKTMFLHYLTIEQQITGLTALKMASNPDTSTMTDVGQAIQAEADIEALTTETKIDQDLRMKMLDDSIIKSFFNTKLVRGLAKPLFKFRYDDDIQEYIQDYLSDFQNVAPLKAVFGRTYREKFPVVFRNDILSYIFQNALRKYSLGKEYSSYAIEEKIPLELVPALKFGAHVADTKTGPKIFIDPVQIQKEFFDKAYLEGTEAKNSYEDRGLYPLAPGHFGSNIASNKDEYIRFVIEREYLRSLYPMSEVSKTIEFKNEYEKALKTRVKGGESENRRFAYEKIIATKALDNTLNPYHLFNDREGAYAIRLEKIKSQYANDFVKDYPILGRFVTDSNRDKTMFNLYVDDKDMDTFKSNLYTQNLDDLSNRQVSKVKDVAENNRISDFFAKSTYVAMLQAGVNKSKYNFLSLTDFSKFIDIMNDETAQFLNASNKLQMLIDFKNKFEQANSQTNRDRGRFKNYLTALKVEPYNIQFSKPEDTAEISEDDVVTNDALVERKNLIPTLNANVFVYNDLSGTEKAYKFIVDNNQDITFVYQFSFGQQQSFDKMTEEEFNKKKLTGQVQLKKLANSSSVGIITGQNSVTDSFSKTDPKYFKGLKTEIEKSISAINDVIDKGGKVAFSMNGYGDPVLMPKELFVYLSRRLFEEFQYLNPGSEFSQEVSKEVAKYQTITDAEILAKFEGENNPLNC